MVYTLGESLMDIIFQPDGQITAKAGGGMLNTSVSLGRSGVEVSLISELGDDKTAEYILTFLEKNGVNRRFIKKYYHQNTSVALAHLDDQKVPSFSIYKSYPEKRKLIAPREFQRGDILVFGSIYALDPVTRNELVEIVSRARQGGALIIYDPNIRKHNIGQPLMKQALNENFAFADIVKGSTEDFSNIFGEQTGAFYYAEIRKLNPDALFILTMGENGVIGFDSENIVELAAKDVDVVSTIGAGDAFTAGIVYHLEQLKTRENEPIPTNKLLIGNMLQSGSNFSAEVCQTIENYVQGSVFDRKD